MAGSELHRGLVKTICLFCNYARPSLRTSIRRTTSKQNRVLSSSPPCRATASEGMTSTTDRPLKIIREGAGPSSDKAQQPGDEGASMNLRIVPASPAYFSAKPGFIGHLLSLEALLRRYETLPTVAPIDAPRVAWKKLPEFMAMVGAEPVGSASFHQILNALARLNRIHPALMPQEVIEAMQKYKRHIQPHLIVPKPGVVDEMGRARGVGRRKTSSAVAWVVEGEGEVLINGKTLSQMFGRVHDRESAIWSLKSTSRMDKYNVFAIVKGGGVTGQAEALTLAVAKALLVHEPALKPALRRAGCVSRDPRMVERKKPGHVKARKMPTWVKR